MHKISIVFLVFILLPAFITINGQDQTEKKLVILPFTQNGIDQVSAETAESILRLEIAKITTMKIITRDRTLESINNKSCTDVDCAIEIAKYLDASRIVHLSLSMLGEKIIVQYFIADADTGRGILFDRITASQVEDLEVVMKRVASSIVTVKQISENAEVGMIVEEESKESLRRSSNKNVGIAFGYIYPQYGYSNSDRSFVFDVRLDYEMEEAAAGIMLGVRKGFAMNLYGSYLFSKTDVCPYLGGAFGFHWVSSHEGSNNYSAPGDIYGNRNEKKSDGFEFTLNGGLRLLHTYNFQILVNVDFIITMNDYSDKALVLTIGIL